jgi:C4-dicarboxylate transporter
MTLSEKILLHQVHPLKLATDIGASIVSLYFLWRHQLLIGLLTHFIPPPIGSAAVIAFAKLEPYKHSSLGSYLVRYMTPAAQATRLAGDLITVVAAWYQSLGGLIFGLAIIIVAWTYGLLPLRPR